MGNEIKVTMRKLAELVPYENNPRDNSKAVNAVAESIKEFGFKNPIIVDKGDVIVAGHTRYKAAEKLGLDEVPVIVADDLSDEQIKAFRLADNKTAELAEWKFDLLETELADICEIDMTAFGFDIDAFADKVTDVQEDTFVIDLPDEPTAKLGQIWKLGRHRLICGDSTDAAVIDKLMDGVKANMVMTDPPYGINAEKMTMGTGAKDFYRGEGWDSERPDISIVLTLADNVCIWGGNYFTDILPISNDWLVWHKKNDGLSFSECELAWTNFGRNVRHISHHWGNEKKLHVTMKPVEVIAWAIQQAKERAEVIVDLFGGSGSTLIACEQLNRKCYICELDPRYCDVIVQRWEQYTGQKAELIYG